MNAAIPRLPFRASMRLRVSADSRITVLSRFNGGRPMRGDYTTSFCSSKSDRSSRTSCGIRRSRPSRTSNKPGHGASVPRSLGRCRPQALRFNPARFSFGFGGLGKLLLLLRLALGRRGRSRPTQSGGPSLFTPFLKVQGYRTHNRNSGFAALPQCDDLNARRVRNVPA